MAFHINKSVARSNISFISRRDDAIPADLTDSEWNKYMEGMDESHLRLTTEPTRWVMRLALPYESQKSLQSSQMGVSDAGKMEVRLGFMLDAVRFALVDIQNPSALPEEQHVKFEKDVDGYASKELIAMLHANGLVLELFAAREAALTAASKVPTKK
jgi:hypothetical protein